VEAAHYKWHHENQATAKTSSGDVQEENRTLSLIDDFLNTVPDEVDKSQGRKRKPTPADAAVDYVTYLLESETEDTTEALQETAPTMKGQNLIDEFINNDTGKIQLKEEPEFVPQLEDELSGNESDTGDEGYFTETLARIYIKQGRYTKALEIIKRLNLNYPKKNAYFADQIRFLEKLIINNNKQ